VQVDPIKPTLIPPETKRLKVNNDESLSNFAFKFNLRRYTEAVRVCRALLGGKVGRCKLDPSLTPD
jgi:hypothetical protein